MQDYFSRMQEIVARKGHSKISSRIRFMLQDVIDLRANKWVPRRNENNPKTIDQIQKEAESERLDMQVNSAPLNTPRKDDRNNDRKRNRKFRNFMMHYLRIMMITLIALLLRIIIRTRWLGRSYRRWLESTSRKG